MQAMSAYLKARFMERETPPDLEKASEFYLEAAAKDPDFYPSTRRASIGLVLKNRAADAANLIKKYHFRHKTEVEPIIDLADISMITGLPNESVKWHETAISLQPTNPSLFISLAKIHVVRNADSKALEIITKGANTAGESLMADFAILTGASLLQSAETNRATTWFEFAAHHSGQEKGRMAVVIADIMEQLGDHAKEEYWLSQAIDQPDASPDTYIKLALLMAHRMDIDGAIEVLGNANSLFPDDAMVLSAFAYIHLVSKKPLEASRLFAKILKTTEKNGGVLSEFFYLNYGAACEQSGTFVKASEIFEQGLAIYPRSHQILNYIAYMWAEQNTNLKKALQYILKALAFDKDNGAYLDTLGWIYFRQGRHQEALAAITQADKLIEDDPVINEHLGDTWMAIGDREKAQYYWQKSLELKPDNPLLKAKLLSVRSEDNPSPRSDKK